MFPLICRLPPLISVFALAEGWLFLNWMICLVLLILWLFWEVGSHGYSHHNFRIIFAFIIFIYPSSDWTYYGMVMAVRPGLRPTLRPSVYPSVRVSIRPFSALSQAGDADSSRAPGLTSGLQGSVNVHRGAILLVPQWRCISCFVFYTPICFDILSWNFAHDFV